MYMKKLFFLFLLIYIMLLALSSCSECEHSFAPATCGNASTCTLCGATQGAPLAHNMAEATCTAPATCQLCGKIEGGALGHSFDAATCTSAAACSKCGTSVGDPLEHIFAPATCASGKKCHLCGKVEGEPKAHSFVPATCTAPKTCQVCNAVDGKALGHVFADATCFLPKMCSVCKETDGMPLEHIFEQINCLTDPICSLCGTATEATGHNWQDATCTSPELCINCNETRGEALSHSWTQSSCAEPLLCTRCGNTTTEGIVHELVLENCLLPRYCKNCSYTESEAPGHDWQEASCTLPSYCTACKRSKGSALGHEFVDATCDNPRSCIRCPVTEGVALGHDWVFVSTIAPTCAPGAHVYSCNVCLQTKREIFATAIAQYHLCDESGLCSVCSTQFDVSKMTLVGLSIASNTALARQGIFESPESSNRIYKTIFQSELGLPIVDISGDLSSASANYYIDVSLVFEDEDKSFESIAQLRIQGASSTGYPKKNYTIKLYDPDGSKNKVKINEEWGKQFKYCLKANWVDYSQARNVVSGQLYGDIIDARDYTDELTNLPSGGAIDGFPCVVYNNGKFLGLYTFNIPKDKWMFDMKDSDEKNQAIVMAITWNDEVAMRTEFFYNPSSNWTGSSGWELEYASNEDSTVDNNTTWVADSLTQLIRFVLNNDGEDFKNGIHNYLDLDKTIDSMLYTFFICAGDNISKNILWATFDGVHWFSSVYDMDGTWGMQWDGSLSFKNAESHLINVLASNNNSNYNLLWEKIYLNFYDKIVERYWELRQSVLTIEHITERFEAFFNLIPDFVRKAEKEKWIKVPTQNEDHLAQILDFASKRLEKFDSILVP